MIAIETISAAVNKGKLYYIELVAEYRDKLLDGGKPILEARVFKLKHLIRALSFDIAREYNTDTTQELYVELLKIVSNYSGGEYEIDPDVVLNGRLVIDMSTGVTLEEVQELLADYALLPDRILTGLEYSYDVPTATISAGTYKIDNIVYSASETDFTITACPADLLKKVRFYATTAGTILSVESTPASVVETPEIPDGTLGLYEILVNDAGVDGDPTVDLSGYRPINNNIFDFIALSNGVGMFPSSSGVDVVTGGGDSASLNLYGGVNYLDGAGVVLTGSSNATPNLIRFIKVGFSEIARFSALGNLLLNTGDDNAEDKLQVNGTAKIDGVLKVATPTADAHAVNKGYADATYAPISSVHYRGTYATLAALQTAIPVGNPGDEALVDAGVGADALKYIWDDSDDAWVAGGGGSAASFATLTGSATDNASLSSELTNAKNRANHTGTQPASTITALPVEFGLACSDETTDLTSGTAKVTFRIPYAMTITSITASVNTAPVGSTLVVDINENGTSILSTKLSIDASEKTSTTAAVPYVLSDTAIAADSEITIDIDQVGASTAGKGLKVFIIGTRN